MNHGDQDRPFTLATHSGRFHADDVFAAAMVSVVYPGSRIVRTRDPALLAAADVVFDVGGVYEPSTRRFDHHMRTRPTRPDGTPYSASGLVWRHLGHEVLNVFLPDADGAIKGSVWREMDGCLVTHLDRVDNGIVEPGVADEASVVDLMNPFPGAGPGHREFMTARTFASNVPMRFAMRYAMAVVARDAVAEAVALASDPRVLVPGAYVPWREAVADDGHVAVTFVVHPEEGDGTGWICSTVPSDGPAFATRLDLPAAWAGLRDDELVAATGVADATFCHPGLFVCGARGREGAVALARAALRHPETCHHG